MLETKHQIFINSIKLAIGGEGELNLPIDSEALLHVASMHDLSHLVYYGFYKAGNVELLKDKTKDFKSFHTSAIFRYMKIAKELNDMSSVFERAGIDFIFLKGSKIRFYYPEPWMRTSSDIDVLIKPEAEKDACGVFEKLKYKHVGDWRYVKNYDTPSGVHIELHTEICDDEFVVDEHLKTVWDTAVLEEGFSHKYKMDDCTFLFHHVEHMAKHFRDGGCGVRPFIDLYVLNGRGEGEELFERLDEVGLTEFYRAVKALMEFWFKDGEKNYPRGMDEYVLRGGLFGTYENAVGVNAKKGKLRYLLGRIFPPYAEMKDMYPSLKKQKWLLPFCYVVRFFKVMAKLIIGKGRDELKAVHNTDKKRVEDTRKLFEDLGLRQ